MEPKLNNLAPQLQCIAKSGCALQLICKKKIKKKILIINSCVHIALYYYSRVYTALQFIHLFTLQFICNKKERRNTIFIPTFSPHFHFGPYFFILLLLIPKMENVFYFSPYCHLTNGNYLRGRRSALLAH